MYLDGKGITPYHHIGTTVRTSPDHVSQCNLLQSNPEDHDSKPGGIWIQLVWQELAFDTIVWNPHRMTLPYLKTNLPYLFHKLFLPLLAWTLSRTYDPLYDTREICIYPEKKTVLTIVLIILIISWWLERVTNNTCFCYLKSHINKTFSEFRKSGV